MLISKVPDNDGGKVESTPDHVEGDSHAYQTANELFELMAKNQNFETGDVDTLTTRDLVLLYKNIDLGTKLMSNATDIKRRKPNQHVENVVYKDEPESESSDFSDEYSSEDLHDVFLVNNERLDLINTPSSVENTLCPKLGNLEIQSSDLTSEYDKQFLFKDPYIKEQLKSLKIMNNSSELENPVLPASLLDYICCKRLEDNYNFYMDNIIRYVKHTIEQLKRISNGDYLTDKAKEKWREVENVSEEHVNTKVLATSTSIPLHVERKIGGRQSTWDDIVHSAVDIRSLSKILEKKIVVEVPKLICGSYKFLSKCCADNLIISCKKEKRPVRDTKVSQSRVDVVFQLKRSETGQVISNISSIMILQTAPVVCETPRPEILPLPYEEQTCDMGSPEMKTIITELAPTPTCETNLEESVDSDYGESTKTDGTPIGKGVLDNTEHGSYSDNDGTASVRNSTYQDSSDSSDALREILDKKRKYSKREASCAVFPDDLRVTIQKLTMPSALTEESGEDVSQSTALKKKSPTRARVKSPYENQSYVLEEKKRRKLLEIRERREKKKLALAENCKITKHKYGKGTIMPQSATSVTKLSISNKSFYNSIYGQTTNADASKQAKGRNRKGGKRDVLEISLEGMDGEHEQSMSTPDRNSKKYINRSYYLDDTVTEMMYMNMKQKENEGKDLCSTSTSAISTDFGNHLNLLSQLIGPSESDLVVVDKDTDNKIHLLDDTKVNESNDDNTPKVLSPKSILNIVPSNSPNIEEHDNSDPKKLAPSMECRKRIDKIYTLMHKLGKVGCESKSAKTIAVSTADKVDYNEARTTSTCPGSDSGTSLKHHLPSSSPSSFSFDKNNNAKLNIYNKKPDSPSAIVPKVIISSKSTSTPKTDSSKKDRKRVLTCTITKVPDNPLKAISQLLHEFENVHKSRQKPNTEQKSTKKTEIVISDGKNGSRQSFYKRRSRFDQHNETQTDKYVRVTTPKEKKNKPLKEMEVPKIPYQQIPVDDKHSDKTPKKKITDILDEAKEARGEAVRGPSKLNSRLNSLAQPKRSYVQAHSEEYQIKYGKTLMADRLQRLAAAPPPSILERNSGSANSRSKSKRSGPEAVSTVSVKLSTSPVPPLERAFRHHSSSSSPEARDRLNQGVGPSYKQISVPEPPQVLKKKMVAVESYVKNHFGRATSCNIANELQNMQKSRVPLLPQDIELASTSSPTFEESTELGSRLHHIINTIIRTTTTAKGLEVLTECHESNSKISKENTDDYSINENISRSERISTDSDYAIDVLDDNNVRTSVENVDEVPEKPLEQTNFEEAETTQHNIRLFKSVTELEKLENALCRQISVGTFQKRLRIKNLTLTPKQSMQQMFVLQSGDAGSLLVQSPITQNLKESKAAGISDLTILPVLSKSHLDWNFSNFPMQIATVGYAFPDYKSIQCGSTSLVKLFDEVSKRNEMQNQLRISHNKDDHCLTPAQPPLCLEQAAQADIQPVTLKKFGMEPQVIKQELDKKEDVKKSLSTNTDRKHMSIDHSENKTKENDIISEQTQTNKVENQETSSAATKPENIEFTSSLDMLVGLLNEIQNITTCQTEITNDSKNQTENQQGKEVETILSKSPILDNSIKTCPSDVVSFTSLDRLRQLDSNPSLYSFYLSDIDGAEKSSNKLNFPPEIISLRANDLFKPKRLYADKQVGEDYIDREVVNKFTEVPSQIFPLGLNHSTNVTNSLLGVLSEPSAQSILSYAEYHSIYSNPSSLDNNNIDIPNIIITRDSVQSLTDLKVIIETPNQNNLNKRKESYEKGKIKRNKEINKSTLRFKTDLDPIMKIKRDILVTVYSILVFTVFAALSFPEMLYRV